MPGSGAEEGEEPKPRNPILSDVEVVRGVRSEVGEVVVVDVERLSYRVGGDGCQGMSVPPDLGTLPRNERYRRLKPFAIQFGIPCKLCISGAW